MMNATSKSFIHDVMGEDVDNLVLKFREFIAPGYREGVKTTKLFFGILELLYNSVPDEPVNGRPISDSNK